MPLAHPTPRLPLAALASVTLLLACPGPAAPDLDSATGSPADSDTTGTTAPSETATEAPTTGPSPGDDEPTTSSTGAFSTSGQDPSDSTSDAGTASTSGPEFGQCPYEPAGVEVTLARVEQGVTTDLTTRECGAIEQFSALQVIAASADELELSVCADTTCGACDPADLVTLGLSLPDGFAGQLAHLDVGDCVQLGVDWARPADAPQACAPSGLALVGLRNGQPEAVPKFMYRYTETLPHTDTVGPFGLTGVLHAPGAIACPCDGDCCSEQPGSRRLRFIADLYNAEIEAPPIDPGATIPLFAFATPEGDDLYGDLALVRAYVPADCAAPARHEWLLRVTPG